QAASTATQQSATPTPAGPSPTSLAVSQPPQRTPSASSPGPSNAVVSQKPQAAPSATPPGPSQPSAQETPTRPAASPAPSVADAKQIPPPAAHDHGMQTTAANAPSPSAMREQAPVATAAAAASGDGDAAAGRLVYRKCQACHSMEAGKNILGPSLAGIMGRKAGAEPSYNYSSAMKQSGLVWDRNTMDAYLADPQKLVPGNKMPFPGLKTD